MKDSYPRFTVAAVQAAPVMFDREKTIYKAIRFIEEAADNGAKIIGFPELYISGHPMHWYQAKKTNPLYDQGKIFAQLVKNGIKVPGPETTRLCNAAKKAHSYVVMGMTEVDNLFPGTVYISQLIVSDKGEIMGVHRKMVTTTVEKLIYSTGDGSYLNVYDSPFGKLSAMVCGEHANSLFKYAVLSMGAQIHVAGWPSFPDKIATQVQRDSVQFRVRQFAHEGKIFVINSCAVTDEQNIDFCCNTREERSMFTSTGGGSAIIGPSGEYLAGPMLEGEGVITAEISLEDALPVKQKHNVLGNYARWDVLNLNFNQNRLSPLERKASGQNSLMDLFSEVIAIRKKLDEINEKIDILLKRVKA